MELDRSARPRGPHTTREGRFVDEPPDPDHPCSTAALGLVPDPPGWTRRAKATRCPGPGKAPDRIPSDVGIVDVRPNVRRDTRERGCRTLFRSWSIKSHEDACVVAEVQDVWILGARFHINERELARARRGRVEGGRATREKNVNSWVYGFAVPAGSITPDPASAVVIGYDPWSIVHPGFFEVAAGEYRSRSGRDVRDDRFDAGEQYAAAHLWIDPSTRSPRIVVYRRLLSVDSTLLPNPIRGLIMRPQKRRTSRRNPGKCGCSPNPLPGRGTYPAPRRAKEDRRKVLPEVEQQPHSPGAGFASRRSGAFEMFATTQSAQTARDKLAAKGSPYGYAELRQVASPGRGRTYGTVLEVPPNPGHPAWEAAGIGAGGRVAGPSGWAGAYDLAEQEYYLRPIVGRPRALPLPAPPAPPAPPPAPRYRAPGQLSLLPERQLRLFNPARARAAVVRLNASESASLARGDRAFARRVLAAARGLALRHGVPVRVEDSAGVAILRVRAPR